MGDITDLDSKRPGARFIAVLPKGWDERTRIMAVGDKIVATHPGFSPMLFDPKANTFETLADAPSPKP